jgi:tetratricopeptide (TPR) repeat protein
MSDRDLVNSRIRQAFSEGNCSEVIALASKLDLAHDEDADLAFIVAKSYIELGRLPFNENMLSAAVEWLSALWSMGNRSPEVVWPLAWALYDLGKFESALSFLSKYVQDTPDPSEHVRAGEYLAQVEDVLGKYRRAVNIHQASLRGLGARADSIVRLRSYLNAHVAHAYGQAKRGRIWMREALDCWEVLEDTTRTIHLAVWLLRGADLAANSNMDTVRLITVGEHFLEIFQRPAALAELGALCSLQTDMFEICHRAGTTDKAARMLSAAKTSIQQIMGHKDRDEDQQPADELLYEMYHNLGCQCRKAGFKREALDFLYKAEGCASRASGPTYFFLAALTLETTGDKSAALNLLRRAAEDRLWAYEGRCESLRSACSSDAAFDGIRNDPEFLTIVDGLRKTE